MKIFFLFLAITFIVSCSSDTNSTNDQNFIEENSSDIQSETNQSLNKSDEKIIQTQVPAKSELPIDEQKETDALISAEFGPDSGNFFRANYRVREQLARLPSPIEAVGFTEYITGGIFINSKGKPNSNSFFNIDLSKLRSDESKRDNYLRSNSLETNKFPNAEFKIKDIVGLDPEKLINSDLKTLDFQLIGDLSIHGVTNEKSWNISAIYEQGTLKGKGSISFPFSDFNMDIPQLFFIVSVEDKITLEIEFEAALKIDDSSFAILDIFSTNNDSNNSFYTNAWLCTENESITVDDLSTEVEELWKCFVDVEIIDDSVIITSSGIPNHDFESGLGCCAQEVNYEWIIPVNPKFTEDITMAPKRGPIAITVTGVPIFGPEEGPGGDAVALHFDYFEEDRQPIEIGICGGHSAGAYFHYHFDANCLHWHPEGEGLSWEDWDYTMNLNPDEHSPIIGFAFDGFPIYGPYGWDSYKNIVEITSSYRLKNNTDGYNGIDDWEYIEGLGDTDECNGILSSTPEAPDGIYHYVSSIRNGDGDIGFPYFLLCYHGVPEESNFQQSIRQQGPQNERRERNQILPIRQIGLPPDLSQAASKLGVSQEELISALGGPPPNIQRASEILNISIEELLDIIPLPPQ